MTTTTKIAVNENWQSIATGSAFVQLKGYGLIYLVAGNALPDANNDSYITLNGHDKNFDWGGSDTLYAKTDPGLVEDLVVWTP